LEAELRSSLEAPTSPLSRARELDECVVQQAGGLPLASLRNLATSNPGVSEVDPLLARCVALGKGLSWVRGVIADVVAGKLPPPIPVDFTRCVVAGVDTLSPAQLAAALNQGATGNQSSSRRLGQGIALACVEKPAIFAHWRGLWVSGIQHSLQGHHLPAKFVQCVLGKAGQIDAAQLTTLVQAGSAAENAYGQRLGRACRAAIGR
jgi:hypothetical protein